MGDYIINYGIMISNLFRSLEMKQPTINAKNKKIIYIEDRVHD